MHAFLRCFATRFRAFVEQDPGAFCLNGAESRSRRRVWETGMRIDRGRLLEFRRRSTVSQVRVGIHSKRVPPTERNGTPPPRNRNKLYTIAAEIPAKAGERGNVNLPDKKR